MLITSNVFYSLWSETVGLEFFFRTLKLCWEKCLMWIHDCLCLRSTGFWYSPGDIRAMQEWQTAVERHQEDSEAELIQILACQTSSKLPCWQLAKVGDRCNSDLWRSNANFGAQAFDSDSWKKAVARSGFIL